MRTIGLALAAGVLLAAGGACAQEAAAPNPLEAAFDKLCVATHADGAQVVAAADADGWQAAPESVTNAPAFRQSVAQMSPQNLQARTKMDGQRRLVILTGTGSLPMGPDETLKLNFCSIGMEGMPGEAVRTDVRGKLGFDPVHTDDASDLYAFTEHDGSRDPFKGADLDAIKKAGASGNLSLMVVVGQPTNVSMVYAVAVGDGK
jgi:hypothetical protein